MTGLISKERYRTDIISLWQECFGDEEEYVEFFLDGCPSECIAVTENDRLVSMLFLLDGNIGNFKVKYIYAACTAKNHRGKGLMQKLIEYAKAYCTQISYDALFLVPAEESLYGYYDKLGFMYGFERSEYSFSGASLNFTELKELTDIDEIMNARYLLTDKEKTFLFDDEVNKYAVKEHIFSGGRVFVNNGVMADFITFAIFEEENVYIKEILCSKHVEMLKIIKQIINIGKENIYIRCPIVYNNTDKLGKYAKCGMFYPLTDEMNNSSVNKNFYAGLYLD